MIICDVKVSIFLIRRVEVVLDEKQIKMKLLNGTNYFFKIFYITVIAHSLIIFLLDMMFLSCILKFFATLLQSFTSLILIINLLQNLLHQKISE